MRGLKSLPNTTFFGTSQAPGPARMGSTVRAIIYSGPGAMD